MDGNAKSSKYFAADTDVDLEQMAKDELVRLQRQYRLMEGDRHEYAQQSGTTISRANRIMTLLRAEKENLLLDYANAASQHCQDADKTNQQLVVNLLNRYDQYRLEMKDKIKQIKEEETQVDKITDRIVKQRLKMQSLHGQSLTMPQLVKRMKILEDRLYNVTTMYDSRNSKNNGLRQAINLLLMERAHFHRRHLLLKRQIAVVKAKMLQNVYQATQTYDSRDDDVQKMKILRERDEKESKQHVLEIKELDRLLHNDEKKHKFLVKKNVRRFLLEEDADRQRRQEGVKERSIDKVLLAYKRSVKEILKLAGIQDVDKLCAAYNEQEQRNFVRFQYITNVNNECEVIKEAINILKIDIEAVSGECDGKQEEEINILADSRDQLLTLKLYLEKLYQTIDFANDKIQKVIIGVEEAFTAAECNNSPVMQLLGNYNGLHARNLKHCLGVLEVTLRDLIREKHALEARKAAEIDGISIIKHYIPPTGQMKPKAQGGPYKPKVMLTGRLNPSEEDDEEEKALSKRPMYWEEFTKSITEKMKAAGVIGHNLNDADDQQLSPHSSASLATHHRSEVSHDGNKGVANSHHSHQSQGPLPPSELKQGSTTDYPNPNRKSVLGKTN